MLKKIINEIKPLDKSYITKAKNRVDNLIKPIGSLGKLEDLAIQLSAIYKDTKPNVDSSSLIVICADHGVFSEGVASATQDVTIKQAINIPNRISGAGALSKLNNTKIYSVDLGINSNIKNNLLIDEKLMMGTNNIKKGPAMTKEICIKAIEIGIKYAIKSVEEGSKVICVGEMGIANTTPSSAILSILTDKTVEEVTGVGANLPIDKLQNKIDVIKEAIRVNNPKKDDPIDIIHKIGGLDIAGMVGVFLGAAYSKTPVIVDGFISTVSAILATMLSPNSKEYMISSHYSLEKGAKIANDKLGLTPYLDMNMRLGEGSGALLMIPVLMSACIMINSMITFEEASIIAI